jgi:hypothetical protein
MAIYKLQKGQYAVVDTGLSRGDAPIKYETIRHLFPDQNAFVPPDAVNENEVIFERFMPGRGIRNALGLRRALRGNDFPCYRAFNLDGPPLPPSSKRWFLERFSMAMHARGVTKREARFEADLVTSWASMRNIPYDYNKNDSLAVALQRCWPRSARTTP